MKLFYSTIFHFVNQFLLLKVVFGLRRIITGLNSRNLSMSVSMNKDLESLEKRRNDVPTDRKRHFEEEHKRHLKCKNVMAYVSTETADSTRR